MRVLAYSFHRSHEARAARESLVREFQLRSSDADVAPMASNGVVLAVRAREDNLQAVKQVLERHGGSPADEIAEEWTIR